MNNKKPDETPPTNVDKVLRRVLNTKPKIRVILYYNPNISRHKVHKIHQTVL